MTSQLKTSGISCSQFHSVSLPPLLQLIMAAPNRYLCPITQEVMVHPMMDREGHNFEQAAILDWLQRSSCCPMGVHIWHMAHILCDIKCMSHMTCVTHYFDDTLMIALLMFYLLCPEIPVT